MAPSTSPSTSTRQPLSILGFGDSLTEGYSRYGTKFTPYSRNLSSVLSASPLANQYNIKITTEGASGQLVTAGFQQRLYKTLKAKDGKYDWMIFLGGTNDLGWGTPVKDIWEGIENCAEMVLEKGGKVLLMTVPECEVKNARLDGRRNELNSLMKEVDREGVFVFDLWKEIPFHAMDPQERKRIWDDGLHFTEEGYARVGKLVAERLIDILEGEKKVESSPAA